MAKIMAMPLLHRPWRSVLTGLILLSLLLSLVANALLASRLQVAFQRLHTQRIFPLGHVPVPVPEPAVPVPGSAAVVGLSLGVWGDSRAADWAAALRLPQGMAHGPVLNQAHGSQTSAQTLLQLRSQPRQRVDVALLQVGINDLHPLGALGGLGEAARRQLHQNLRQLRDELLKTSRTVVLTTIVMPGPVPWTRRPAWDPQTTAHIQAANTLLRSLADGDRVQLLDAADLLGQGPTGVHPQYLSSDFFLHLNTAAYARLNAALAQILASRPPTSARQASRTE
jgi:lysophospholipase L1-like esterase